MQVESRYDQVGSGMEDVPFNQWYVAAGRAEIGRQLLARRLLDIPVVLFRTQDGKAVALRDTCPHRLLPLSQGRLIGDEIQCAYHGMMFGSDGLCTRIPTQNAIPRHMCVESYPLVEKGLWAWIWLGDREKMDPGLIPEPGYVQSSQAGVFEFCYPIKCHFIALHENLMDTSHPTFLHPSFFDEGELAAAPYKVETRGLMIRVVRQSADYVPNPALARQFDLEPGARVRRTLITETHAPCLNTIFNRYSYSDDAARPPLEVVSELPVTPGGPNLCYHFMSSYWSFNSPPEKVTAFLKEVVQQDAVALEAISGRLLVEPNVREVSVRADEGAIKLRRLIKQMAAAERA